jgi:hypothetical protein
MHRAADEAVNDLKHRTRQRRRIERDVLLGVMMHEEQTKRWRKAAGCGMRTQSGSPRGSCK